MLKKTYGQKKVIKKYLADYTEEQAKAEGEIFHKVWEGYWELQEEKNRKLIEKVLANKIKK